MRHDFFLEIEDEAKLSGPLTSMNLAFFDSKCTFVAVKVWKFLPGFIQALNC